MVGVPHAHLVAGERLKILFNHRFRHAQLEVLVQPRVHHRPAHVVVIVRKLHQRLGHHQVLGAEHLVELLELGEALGFDFLGPVVGGRHAQRAGRDQGRDLDIPRAHAQIAGVLAGAAALHGGGNHDGRKSDGRAGIDRAEHEGLRAPAAGPRHGDPLRIHLGQRAEEVQRADGIVGLEPEDGLQPEFGLRAEIAPIFRRVHPGSHARAVLQLHAVGVADHVVMEDHAAHAGQLHAAGLQDVAAAHLETFGPFHERLANRGGTVIGEAAVGPMPVRTQHARHAAVDALGPIQITGDEMAWKTFQIDFLDRVLPAVHAAVDHGVGRGFGGHGPEPGGHQDLSPQPLGPFGPFLGCGTGGERKITVERFQGPQPAILRELPGREHPRGFGLGRGRQQEDQQWHYQRPDP